MKTGVVGIAFTARHRVPSCTACCLREHSHHFFVDCVVEGVGEPLDFHLLERYVGELVHEFEGKSINKELGVSSGTCEVVANVISVRLRDRLERLASGKEITIRVWQGKRFYGEVTN
jgi:6-pyruvoyl-tetrahydropterin synthase